MILMLGSFNLGSDQSLPPELAKHDPLDRPQVIIGASITVWTWCTYSRPNVLARFGGGGGEGIDDLMVLLRNVPQASKSRQSLFQLAQAASRVVFVYHFHP